MGKLGKPQKSKKHKKLKKTFDTFADSDFNIEGSRNKLGNLPVNDEDLDRQEIPRKARDIAKSRQNIGRKQIKDKKKKNRKIKVATERYRMEKGMTRPQAPIPKFVQGKYEKDRDFMKRVEIEAQRVVMTKKMEEKYKIDLSSSRNNLKKVPKKERSERKKEKDRERKKKKGFAQKERKLEEERDFRALKDHVEFGEVAMAPPSLTAKPRKADMTDLKPRPGKKSLLLKSMIDGRESSTDKSADDRIASAVKSVAKRQVGQSVKRKNLSPAQRQINDFQRQRAIDMYRDIRNKKYELNNLKT